MQLFSLSVSTILCLINHLYSSVSATIQLNLPTSAQVAAADPGKKSKKFSDQFFVTNSVHKLLYFNNAGTFSSFITADTISVFSFPRLPSAVHHGCIYDLIILSSFFFYVSMFCRVLCQVSI